MPDEKVIPVQIISADGHAEHGKLYVRFTGHIFETLGRFNFGTTVMVLNSPSNSIKQEVNHDYLQCLTHLKHQLPEGYKIKFENTLEVEWELGSEYIKIDEFVYFSEDDEQRDRNTLYFILKCNYHGVCYEVNGAESYFQGMIALQTRMKVTFKICATCDYGSSYDQNSQDERHNYYCFRDIHPENSFEKAYGNLNAYHWCPQYKLAEWARVPLR